MTTYCFKCPACGRTTQVQHREGQWCACTKMARPTAMVRDYGAEGVGIGPGVRASREVLSSDGYRQLFLPSADELRTPDDPTGQAAMREWRETHVPHSKHPIEPEIERTTF